MSLDDEREGRGAARLDPNIRPALADLSDHGACEQRSARVAMAAAWKAACIFWRKLEPRSIPVPAARFGIAVLKASPKTIRAWLELEDEGAFPLIPLLHPRPFDSIAA